MKNIQICATVPEEVNNEIVALAEKDRITYSQSVGRLLLSALKERKRNREKKNAKKTNTEHHSPNLG